VVDDNKVVIGVVTEFDLIKAKGSQDRKGAGTPSGSAISKRISRKQIS